MNRALLKIFIKSSVFIIIFAIIWICVKCFPMRFWDGEYPDYFQNRQFSETDDEYTRILIMGDSVSKAAYLPAKLSDDTYNFALGGATPLEEYYYLKDYLENHKAPEYVFYTTYSTHLVTGSTFWGRSVYFRRFSKANMMDLLDNLEELDDYSVIGDKDAYSRFLEFYYYLPSEYSAAYKDVLLFRSHYRTNLERYNNIEKNKGQTNYGTANYCDDVNDVALETDFVVDKALEYYLEKLIILCNENDITFIWKNPPFNESTFNALNDSFVEDYVNFLEGLSNKYPNIIIETKLYSYENKYFGDAAHLNYNGTLKFSDDIKNEYAYIFN